ncbi:MAG: hypothetical protein DRO67_02515 [Candidatus Asgardarchaeum californiense]|nr:MAG: hypothetical protein DRO67_02515 [Candidatus Asgardarchaeum californiense]
MSFIEDLILAIIQAILEWLPVSSEGFLILTAVNVFHKPAIEAFRAAIYFHLGTALAVFFKYNKKYINTILFRDLPLLRFLVISAVATAVTGIPLYILLSESFSLFDGMLVTLFIGIALLVTGSLLRFGVLKSSDTLASSERKILDEFLVGIFQGFAILPGISRSGTTVTYFLARGFKKKDAFEMSFLISLPAVLGAIAFDIAYHGTTVALSLEYFILTGLVAVLGYVMMNLLLQLAERLSFDKICYFLGCITIVLVILFYAMF